MLIYPQLDSLLVCSDSWTQLKCHEIINEITHFISFNNTLLRAGLSCAFPLFWFFLGAVGGDETTDEDKEKAEEEERERLEAIREAEDRRKEKHRKMEEEREKMRQEIRDKVSAMNIFI